MNVNNFIVRPRRRLVEQYADPKAWGILGPEQYAALSGGVAGLPSELQDNDEEAKRFDLLVLRLQLAVLRVEPSFAPLRDQVKEIAGMLEEKSSIPMVRDQMALIQEVQTEEFWQDVTTPMLENVRKRLRLLVKLIEKAKRKPIYTDFEDELGGDRPVELPGFGASSDFEHFRAKAHQFLKAHENHITIHKLRLNEPLTASDLSELEKILLEAGVGTAADINRAKEESKGLGLFVRSLVGLDREAAKRAFDKFHAGKSLSANQLEFIDVIINHLTQNGWMDEALLYESPFTDFNPLGVEGVFNPAQVTELMSVLKDIRLRTAA